MLGLAKYNLEPSTQMNKPTLSLSFVSVYAQLLLGANTLRDFIERYTTYNKKEEEIGAIARSHPKRSWWIIPASIALFLLLAGLSIIALMDISFFQKMKYVSGWSFTFGAWAGVMISILWFMNLRWTFNALGAETEKVYWHITNSIKILRKEMRKYRCSTLDQLINELAQEKDQLEKEEIPLLDPEGKINRHKKICHLLSILKREKISTKTLLRRST